jgi:hypothetical protein
LSDSFRSKKAQTSFNPSTASTSAKLKIANGGYEYTGNDGTVVNFNPMSGYFSEVDCIKGEAEGCVFAHKIKKLDGTEYNLEYDSNGVSTVLATRLRSIVSNKGYALLFEYLPTTAATLGYNLISKACVLNLAVTQKPADNNCPADAIKSTYTYSGASLLEASDGSGGVHKIAKTNVSGAKALELTWPGQTAPFV